MIAQASNFEGYVEYGGAPKVRQHRLNWWEDAPRQLRERVYSEPQRAYRRERFYKSRPRNIAVSCSVAWKPIFLAPTATMP